MNDKKVQGNGNGQKNQILFDDLNTVNSSIHEDLQNGSPLTLSEMNEKINSFMKLVNTLTNDISQLKTENSQIKAANDTLTNDVSQLKTENSQFKAANDQMAIKMKKIETRLDALESLVIRNNLNIDLLANRDSLKTILLLFSVNLGVTSIDKIKSISETSEYKEKFQ